MTAPDPDPETGPRPPAGLALRRLGEEDWPLWRRLRRAALADAPGAFGSTLAQWSGDGDREERWRARLREVALHLVVERDGEPVGVVAAAAPVEEDVVQLISLWVDPEARGTGAGDVAVRGVVAWAASEHPGVDVVLSVASGNDAAARLYARHGFVEDGPSPDAGCERRLRRRS
ncbi:GNAT family N-acetyltransferase [uncultured Pseudokineococcus sp.]|uniref:GNAT family N-acetyltransferase n=1 Tax=uncultured Pseudokineococcus sp. TaxID=1642928 RepID=UPI00260BF515|nr:GNAT family N-acetyltransferase [uncultured Pseudokineococcus sp.]